MKAYGKNLRWIEDRQYDGIHSGISIPSCGKKRGQRHKRYKRLFKKMRRQHLKNRIKDEISEY